MACAEAIRKSAPPTRIPLCRIFTRSATPPKRRRRGRRRYNQLTTARESGNRSGQYLANTVLFATVLFFAGTAGKFEQPRVRLSAALFGVAVFVLPSFACS